MKAKLATIALLLVMILCSTGVSEEITDKETGPADNRTENIAFISRFNLIEEYAVKLSHPVVQIDKCGILNESLTYILYFTQGKGESLAYIMDVFSNYGKLLFTNQFCMFEPKESLWPYIQIEERKGTFVVEYYPNITIMDELFLYEYDFNGNLISQGIKHLLEGSASYISFQGKNYVCRKQAHSPNDNPCQLISIQHISTGTMYEMLIDDRMATMAEDDDESLWVAFVEMQGDIILNHFSISGGILNQSTFAVPDIRLPESAYIQSIACDDETIMILVRISNGDYSLLCFDKATMRSIASWNLQPPNDQVFIDKLMTAGDSVLVVDAQWKDSIQSTVLRPSYTIFGDYALYSIEGQTNETISMLPQSVYIQCIEFESTQTLLIRLFAVTGE